MDRAMKVASEVVEALREAHGRRIVHRDLKPGNLMLTAQGHVKVMDFGLAKRLGPSDGDASQAATREALTQPGAFIGTPAYMAPEQILGDAADERSDIFSFGVVLYELLTSEHPFRKETTSATLGAILRDPPLPPGGAVDPSTCTILRQAASERAERSLSELRRGRG